MPASASEWDVRHREAAKRTVAEPADIVGEWLPLLPKGSALDLACGTGRHTLLLAACGQAVTAIDWSAAALEIVEERARKADLRVRRMDAAALAAGHFGKGIQLIQADLEQISLPDESFDLILCLQYLQRSLFPQISRALRPEGVLLFETFTRAQLQYAEGPRNPEHLLDPSELRTAFPKLRVLFYRELSAGQGIASLIARKPVQSGAASARCAYRGDRGG